MEKYVLLPSGAIGNRTGILYEADCIKDLSTKAKRRLAQLHSEDEELDWEGAEQILIREGLMAQ